MRKLFIIESDNEIQKLIEINGVAHAITNNGTFKIRQTICSNTFVYMESNSELCSIPLNENRDVTTSIPLNKDRDVTTSIPLEIRENKDTITLCDKENNDFYKTGNETKIKNTLKYNLVEKTYELEPLDMDLVFRLIPVSRLISLNFINLTDYMTESEASEFIIKYKLVTRDKFMVTRIMNKDIVKVLKYLQSIGSSDEFNLWDISVKNWAYKNFKGTSSEIGYYILLDNQKNIEFMNIWKKNTLDPIDIDDLINFIKTQNNKHDLVNFLQNFK